uniref:Uncharacterized protein n=1 Tax=Romanomermis culicivorax TaxID=13658 RepID=A0A915K2A0_ROMCU
MIPKLLKILFLRHPVQLQTWICHFYRKFINEKFNSELKKEPLKMPLIKPDTPLPALFTSSGFGKKLAADVLQKMTFDRSLTKDPEFNANTGDFYLRGECSINGQGGTPFGPAFLNENTFPRLDNSLILEL